VAAAGARCHAKSVVSAETLETTIVIVDDNETFLRAARRLLEGEGLRVVGLASSFEEGLELAAERRPDVVLVDIDLGAESGFDLAQRLSDQEASKATRVILVSAYAQRDFADLIEASPAVGFMSKTEISAQKIFRLLEDRGAG
jgi:CheY-like chemotaxis protein